MAKRGWWGLACWNGLSPEQQTTLIEVGTLSIDYRPAGTCEHGASVCIETEADAAPGPRFYCWGCAVAYLQELEGSAMSTPGREPEWSPSYSRWRHGGWYVDNVRYPSGAVGCVSRNYDDQKWRIVCDKRPGSFPGGPNDHTYPSRDAAARAERDIALAEENKRSTDDAYRTVLVYRQYAGIEALPMDESIRRFVFDLRLLAEEYGCDWAEALAHATTAEIDGLEVSP